MPFADGETEAQKGPKANAKQGENVSLFLIL